jgi:hypothetical protein
MSVRLCISEKKAKNISQLIRNIYVKAIILFVIFILFFSIIMRTIRYYKKLYMFLNIFLLY